jgi:hypothetical protein
LTTLKEEKISQVNTRETTSKNVTINETRNIQTQQNPITEKDTFEERKKKLKEQQEEEKKLKEAKHKDDLAQLGLNLEEIDRVQEIWADGVVDFEEEKFLQELERKGIQIDKLKQLQEQYYKDVKEMSENHSDSTKDLANEELQAYVTAFKKIGDASQELADLFEEQTVAHKALTGVNKAINAANAIMNTYRGISEIWASKSVLPEPIGTAQKVASTIIAATSGFKAVKGILATKTPGGSGGGGVSAPSVSEVTAPIIQAVQTQAATQVVGDVRVTNQSTQPIKAFIVDRDLKNQEEKSNFLNKLSSI